MEIMVDPAWVIVAGVAGTVEVTTEVIVDAGTTIVDPGKVITLPGAVKVVI